MREAKSPGRPTKLTPKLQREICKHLASGCYAVTACAVCGIGETTFYNWLERGAKGEEPYAEFVASVKEAEHLAEVRAVALVQKAMVDDWKAAMTWLERKFPDRWSRGERRELSHSGGVQHIIEIEVVEPEHEHGIDDADVDT